MQTKLYTKDFKENLSGVIVVTVILVATVVFAWVQSPKRIGAELGIMLVGMLLWVFFLVRFLRCPGYVLVEEDALRSCSILGRPLCTVYLDRCVYYACYDHYTGRRYNCEDDDFEPQAVHCVVSNEIFLASSQLNKPLKEPLYLDRRKVIVFELNQRSEAVLHLDRWVKLSG